MSFMAALDFVMKLEPRSAPAAVRWQKAGVEDCDAAVLPSFMEGPSAPFREPPGRPGSRRLAWISECAAKAGFRVRTWIGVGNAMWQRRWARVVARV